MNSYFPPSDIKVKIHKEKYMFTVFFIMFYADLNICVFRGFIINFILRM